MQKRDPELMDVNQVMIFVINSYNPTALMIRNIIFHLMFQ